MLSWSLSLFIGASIAAGFGFGGVASGAAELARVCCFFFIVAFLATLIWSVAAARRPRPRL